MDHKILFETSPWFILLCILAGLFYAVLLYKKKNPWTKKESLILGSIRFFAVSALTFLLLGPLVRQIRNIILEPTTVVVVDNSQSVSAIYSETELTDLKNSIRNLIKTLQDKDLHVELEFLNGESISETSGIVFNLPATNLSETLNEIENKYEGKNLQQVILISDGIYNQGISPAYSNYSFPIYTLGVGDTTEKDDVILKSLISNKIVYQGNRFPIVAEVVNNGFRGENIQIDVLKNGRIIETKTVMLSEDQGYKRVEFELNAENSGIQRYLVSIRALQNEFSESNNRQETYIEVVEGKEKILLLASAPHPDIKALKSAIEKNENYELALGIPGISEYEEQKYDLVILHQLPDRNNSFNQVIEKFVGENTPLWFITGESTAVARFNNMNRSLELRILRNQFDNIFPAFNPNFTLFNISEETREMMSGLPPVPVPFGEYVLKTETEVILFQQVGKIVTNKPLLMLNRNQAFKEAVLTGTGIWQWRLNDYMENETFSGFDDLISKIVQYLSAKEDKRKFRVYPVKNEFRDNEPVIFETEIYNDLYEKIYGQKIDLTVRDENDSSRSYSYVISPANSRFRISGLQPGVHNYSARTNVDGEIRAASGMFSVKKMQIELTSVTADHRLLKELSRRSGGRFFDYSRIDELDDTIQESDVTPMILSSENYLAIINMKWIFFVLLALFTLEWGSRKYLGGY
jgi:hypothetical protein